MKTKTQLAPSVATGAFFRIGRFFTAAGWWSTRLALALQAANFTGGVMGVRRDDTITEYRYVSTCYLCDGWGVIPTPPNRFPLPTDFACHCAEGLKVQERRKKQALFYNQLRLTG